VSMTTFIAIVQGDSTGGYTASFPDFPQCFASSPTLEEVIKQAREALLQRIEGLLEAGHAIASPTAMEAIQRRGDTLFAAIEVPDDLRSAQVEIVIPGCRWQEWRALRIGMGCRSPRSLSKRSTAGPCRKLRLVRAEAGFLTVPRCSILAARRN
jgi:predicted RNase H-like HicB family nuclease